MKSVQTALRDTVEKTAADGPDICMCVCVDVYEYCIIPDVSVVQRDTI